MFFFQKGISPGKTKFKFDASRDKKGFVRWAQEHLSIKLDSYHSIIQFFE